MVVDVSESASTGERCGHAVGAARYCEILWSCLAAWERALQEPLLASPTSANPSQNPFQDCLAKACIPHCRRQAELPWQTLLAFSI